jgi:amino acid permease
MNCHCLFATIADGAIRSIKVITIVGLIILGIVLDLGGGPNQDRIGKNKLLSRYPDEHYHICRL